MAEASSAESDPNWTPATFLDKAEELRRRLKVWPVPDLTKPIWFGKFQVAEEARRRQFRTEVLRGPHGPKPEDAVTLYPGVLPKEHRENGFVGSAFYDKPSEVDQQYTLWLLRDFYEHLGDAGTSDAAVYLHLKFDRILDAPIRRERAPINDAEREHLAELNSNEDEGPYSIIGGSPVSQELLDEVVDAARALLNARSESGRDATASVAVEWSMPDSPSSWADKLRVSLETLHRWEKSGSIRAKKLSDKIWMIALADLPAELHKSPQKSANLRKEKRSD